MFLQFTDAVRRQRISGACGRLSNIVAFVLLLLAGSCAAEEPPELIPRNSQWRYRATSNSPPEGWETIEFDDSKWKSGKAGFGYGDDDDETVLTEMKGNFSSVQIRHRFNVVDPTLETMLLYIRFDDAFVAYLNGLEVANSFVMTDNGITYADVSHEALAFVRFEITNANKLLREGTNVLAIEGRNVSLNSSDFSLDPFLLSREFEDPRHQLSRQKARADIDELRRRLEDQSSYLTLRQFDYLTALASLDERLGDTISIHDFAYELRKIVTRIGDCQASVYSPIPVPDERFLPFQLVDTRDGIAAIRSDRTDVLEPMFPYVRALDGKPFTEWLAAASKVVNQGSPQLIRHRSLRQIRNVRQVRKELRLPISPNIAVTLAATDGTEVQREFPLELRTYGTGRIPLARRSRLLDNNLGYLRIAQMNDRLVPSIRASMRQFRMTDGLVIDVRDNHGGGYGLTRALYGYFSGANAKPHVNNICAYRLSRDFQPNHLDYRKTYPADFVGWGPEEKEAILTVSKVFQPNWKLPREKFSDWRFLVLSNEGGQTYHYQRPVVVLSNAGSFGSTDGFLSAFTDLPQVTLMGEASSGSSGAVRHFALTESGITVSLSSMASFRRNGELFDGHGIPVDIEVKPMLTDFLGNTDSVLLAAQKLLVDNS